jgi:1-acyl-sn-glycerol-3-phosphate acyltransferase
MPTSEAESPTIAPEQRESSLALWASRLRAYFILDPLIWLYTIVLGTVSLLVSFFDKDGRKQHELARLWSRWILKTTRCPVTVSGAEKLDASHPAAIYAANHLSAMDIPVVFGCLPFQFRIIAKHELFRYPFVGGHLKRSGQIPVNRESPKAALRSLNRAVESLKGGMPLVIFPEGGRAPDGHLMPFMGGPFYAAIKAGVPIVPMAIVGTYEVLPMNSFHLRPRPIELVIGDPISSEGHTLREMDAMAAKTQAVIEELYYARATVGERPAPLPDANA